MAIGKFIIKATKNGGVEFDLKAANGETILTSQTYKSLTLAKSFLHQLKCRPFYIKARLSFAVICDINFFKIKSIYTSSKRF